MIVRIANVYLYTGLTPTGGNNSATALQWLEDNNIEHTNLWYGDPKQHQSVFDALNTWKVGEFLDFPFIIYDIVDDEGHSETLALIGLEAIQNSNLAELAALNPTVK